MLTKLTALAAAIISLSLVAVFVTSPLVFALAPKTGTNLSVSLRSMTSQRFRQPKTVRTGTFTAAFTGGYKATGTLRLGQLTHDAPLSNGGDILGSACDVNEQTDAVVPFLLTLTNATSGFTLSASFGFTLEDTEGNVGILDDIEIEYYAGEQSNCSEWNNGQTAGADVQSNIKPGRTAQFGGFVIIENYYSPSNRNGSINTISEVAIAVGADYVGPEATTLGKVTGRSEMDTQWFGDEVGPQDATTPLNALERLRDDCTVSNPHSSNCS